MISNVLWFCISFVCDWIKLLILLIILDIDFMWVSLFWSDLLMGFIFWKNNWVIKVVCVGKNWYSELIGILVFLVILVIWKLRWFNLIERLWVVLRIVFICVWFCVWVGFFYKGGGWSLGWREIIFWYIWGFFII